MPTTLLVLTASPADRAAPRKLASRGFAKSAPPDPKDPPLTPKDPKPVPRVELPAPLPAWIAILAALCTTQTSAIRAQSCTNEKSPPAQRPRITQTNYDYLDKIDFDSQDCAQPPMLCPASAQGRTGNLFFNSPPRYSRAFAAQCFPRSVHSLAQTQNRAQPAPSCAPPQTRSPRPNRESVFSAAPLIRVHSWPNVFLRSCTVLHKPKPPPIAAPPHNSNNTQPFIKNRLPFAQNGACTRELRQRTSRADSP